MLEAAITRLEQEGEAGIRVREIATASGVSYASLYHFFGDREGLIEAAYAEVYRRSLKVANDIFRAGVDQSNSRREFEEFLTSVIRSVFGEEGARRRAQRRTIEGSVAFRPRLRALLTDAVDESCSQFADALARAQSRGLLSPELNLRTVAVWTIGMVSGRHFLEADPDRYDPHAWNEVATVAMLAVLRPN